MNRQRGSPGAPDTASSGAGLATAALAAGGWLLLLVALPVAIFLTWWGDCFEETCPAASDVDRAVYMFDLGAWLVLPALAFGAYRGWRPAAVALVAVGLAIVGQVLAALLGARGFQAFAIVLPAGALIISAGIVGLRPSLGAESGNGPTTRGGLIGLIVVAAVVVAIAFQGVLVGGVGAGQGLLVLVAVSLAFIAVLAFLNRGRGPGAGGQPAPPRRRRR